MTEAARTPRRKLFPLFVIFLGGTCILWMALAVVWKKAAVGTPSPVLVVPRVVDHLRGQGFARVRFDSTDAKLDGMSLSRQVEGKQVRYLLSGDVDGRPGVFQVSIRMQDTGFMLESVVRRETPIESFRELFRKENGE